jgi:hypothetical protein
MQSSLAQHRMAKSINHFGCALIGILLLMNSCDNHSSDGVDDNKFKSVGSYDGNLETGLWKMADQNNRIIEEGYFDSGVRVARWQYYWPNHYSVVWNEFRSVTGKLRTNIPSFFTVWNNYDSLAFFKYYDTTKIFNLVIAITPESTFSTDSEYEKQLFTDIRNRKITVVDTVSEAFATTSGFRYLFHKMTGNLPDSRNITIFNLVQFDSNKRTSEVSLRCEKEFLDVGQMAFYSILPNLFINSERFMDKNDVIAKFFR